jgi:CBS domain-containing protein
MTIVAHILKSKPLDTVYTTTPTASVFDAITLMAEKNVGGLVVIEGERVVGIITERDYARKIALRARSSRETAVRDIMTSAKEPRFRKVLSECTQWLSRPCGLGSWHPLQS